MSDWQTIGTRPTGDAMILVTNGSRVLSISAEDIYREYNGAGEEPGPPMARHHEDLGEITHWRHYPEPPQ